MRKNWGMFFSLSELQKMSYSRLLEKFFNFAYELSRMGKKNVYPSEVLSAEEGNRFLKQKLQENLPFMATRFGANEIGYAYRSFHGLRIPFKLRHSIANTGFFPADDKKLLAKFSEIYMKSAEKADFMGVWNSSEYEGSAISEFCPNATLMPLISLEPYYFNDPWSKALNGKKVLVVHPFAKTIEKQYSKHSKLFENKDVLPDFNLILFKSENTIFGHEKFKNWFEVFDYSCEQIAKIDFDVAIIGAGAYGLPFAAFVKKMGKQAIHMAGATQILFGIKGRRWDKHPIISKFYNESWVRPDAEETPKDHLRVEKGCYW